MVFTVRHSKEEGKYNPGNVEETEWKQSKKECVCVWIFLREMIDFFYSLSSQKKVLPGYEKLPEHE